jgi:hypothetical protein
MKIILDESVPQKLRLLIEGHTVVTVAFQGWSGLKNGALLTAAEDAGYELFITADQEISYQQNLSGRKMALLVLSTNNWDYVKAAIAKIMAAIDAVTPDSYTEVEIPEVRPRPCFSAAFRGARNVPRPSLPASFR